jgi:hypothetical protein
MSEAIKERLTGEEVDDLLKPDDTLTVAIRGHQAIEGLLNLAISEALPNPHTLEVQHVPLALKLDLAVALGIIRTEELPALAKFNSIRNKLVHDRTSMFGKSDARDFYNTWSKGLRYVAQMERSRPSIEPIALLRLGVKVAYVFVEVTISNMRDDKMIVAHALERAEEVLGGSKTREESDKKIEAMRKAERERRAAEGRL